MAKERAPTTSHSCMYVTSLQTEHPTWYEAKSPGARITIYPGRNSKYIFLQNTSQSTLDIREQFALLPWEETQSIAQKLGIRHSTYPGTRTPIVVTSDLVLTRARLKSATIAVGATNTDIQGCTSTALSLEELFLTCYPNILCGSVIAIIKEQRAFPVNSQYPYLLAEGRSVENHMRSMYPHLDTVGSTLSIYLQ